jgi:hypothetical protein
MLEAGHTFKAVEVDVEKDFHVLGTPLQVPPLRTLGYQKVTGGSLGVHLLCFSYVSAMYLHPECMVSAMYLLCIYYVSAMYLLCIYYISAMSPGTASPNTWLPESH